MNEPNIIIPTVGRVVNFRLVGPAWSPTFAINDDNVYAAHVAKVHSPRLVNLLVIDGNGTPWPQQSIPLRQQNDEAPLGNYCEWMPYQKGQAAKTDKAELTAETLLHAIGTRMNEALAKDPHAFTREQVMTIFGLRDAEPGEVFAPASRAEKLADAIAINKYAGDPREAAAIMAGQGAPSAGTHPAIAGTQRLDNDGNPLVSEQQASSYQDHQRQARKRHEDELRAALPPGRVPTLDNDDGNPISHTAYDRADSERRSSKDDPPPTIPQD